MRLSDNNFMEFRSSVLAHGYAKCMFLLVFFIVYLPCTQANTPLDAQMLGSQASLNSTILPSPDLFLMPNRESQRAAFLRLEKRLWQLDNQAFSEALKDLDDYPLIPYLIERKLSYKMRLSDEQQIREFLSVYEGTPLAKKLSRKWLEYLAKKRKVALFIEFYKPTRNAKLACTFIDYQLKQGATLEDLYTEITDLWTVGKSQPKQCDGIFKKWINANQLTEDLILLRVKKAADGGKHTLIPYLKSLLPDNKKHLADLWHKTRRNPSYVKDLKAFSGKYPLIEAEVMTYGLARLIWRDSDLALNIMDKATNKLTFTHAQKATIYGKFGIKLAIDNDKKAEKYLLKAAEFGKDKEVMRWHLAYLLRQQNWASLVLLLENADPQVVSGNEYSYWLARAYTQLGRSDEAATLYQQLASHRHYYGFLASARVKQPYALEDTPLQSNIEDIKAVLALPSSHNAYELRHLGRFHEARLEWRRTQDLVTDEQKLVTGVIASAWEWHDQAIFTFAREGYLNDVKRRFPMAYEDVIVREAKKNKIAPEWAFAIARRESSFMSDAVSSANARGLMQILPSTAKYLEKKRVSNRQLFNVETNAKIGSKYLRYLMNKLDGNTVLATASYNAGWRRVKQWLPENEAMDADIWVELIPYRETRNYVKAIMAYKLIYKDQLTANHSQDDNIFSEFISTDIPQSL